MKPNIIVIDFGSQYTNLIAKQIESFGIECYICLENNFIQKLNKNTSGIIISGGPQSVNKIINLSSYDDLFNTKLPIFGICYGMQLIAKYFGGEVSNYQKREFGGARIEILKDSALFSGINFSENNQVWMSHSDDVSKIPNNFDAIAMSNGVIAAIQKNNIYGVQFHPEVKHTSIGKKIFENFLTKICNLKISEQYNSIIEDKISLIRNTVKEERVLLALSGGVDSLVTSVLVNKAIGNKLNCFFVDNGLNRESEAKDAINFLKKTYKMNIEIINARKIFLEKLKSVTEPEQKRKIIGKLFIDIFENITKQGNKYRFLAQGTILSDVIESSKSSTTSKVIKSHHNVGGLPKNLKMEIIEPLNDLLKHEVRELGKSLNIPEKYIYRQPMPGPGYAIRIIGEVNKDNLAILTKADNIFLNELKKRNMYELSSQSFVIFLPVKSVGVMGDCRTYENVLAIRSVETKDFMTAKFSHLPWDFLEYISTKIINEVNGINRVVYDVTSKPPSTIEWE